MERRPLDWAAWQGRLSEMASLAVWARAIANTDVGTRLANEIALAVCTCIGGHVGKGIMAHTGRSAVERRLPRCGSHSDQLG